MFFPRGFPKPALPAATMALAFLPLTSTAGTTSEEVSQTIRSGLPHYDPTAPKPAEAAPVPAPRAVHVLKRVSNPGARIPQEVPKPAEPVVAGESAKPTTIRGVLELPKMTVNGEKAPPPLTYPRLYVPEVQNHSAAAAAPFESPAARDARLVKKHFSPFEQAFNRLLGNSLVGLARQEEARQYSATQFNDIAELLELSLLIGNETPAEQKKLRGEYLDALAARPR